MLQHLIVGTAGHIDHGKTSLIRALTGVDLDTLPEEKARGITIALGFTHLQLGADRVVSFIDVPGHERLVRTMIAGASGMDAALLCVSAAEGVMPQTREHIAILGLLGLKRGLIALTMTDLVEADWLDLARLDVEEAVAGTFLEGAPIIETVATGPAPRGIEALRAALLGLPLADRSAEGPFRLPVDRAFVRKGFGTVVTGTLRSGRVADGDEVEILPVGLRAKVRGLQVHGEKQGSSEAGHRTALNLAGIERDDLERGMVVVHPGSLVPGSLLDLRCQHLPGAPPLQSEDRVRVLIGTAEVMATLSVLSADGLGVEADALADGQAGFVQLRCDEPLVALPGDRVVLRRESPVTTLGGGLLLDPWAPRARRRDRPTAVAQLEALLAGDRGVLLIRAGESGLGAAEQRSRGLPAGAGVSLGDRCFDPARVAAWELRLTEALVAWHREHPLLPGAPRRELHGAVLPQVSERAFDALVARLAEAGALVLEGPRLRAQGFSVHLGPEELRVLEQLEAAAAAGGLEGARYAELFARSPALLHLLIERGTLMRAGEAVYARAVLEGLAERVRALLLEKGEMSPGDFKELSGLSRRGAIPLLEWLDEQRVTLRKGDVRVLRA